jgi:hypothetical protein
MPKRDLRQKLLGHLLEGSGDPVMREVSLTVRCKQCGGRLEMRSDAMTGHAVEECRRCGASRPVPRFRPLGDEEGPGTPAS